MTTVPEHVAAAATPTLRAMIETQVMTGMRPGELVLLRLVDGEV